MTGRLLHLGAILCVAVAMAAAWAHLLALPNKMGLDRDAYLVVQGNWTRMPDNWEALRRQWEFSHAVAAVPYLAALVTLTISATEPTSGS